MNTHQPHSETVDETPRDAASVVLLREQGGQLEVFLLKRSGSRTIVGDAYVFPGGKLDPEDSDPNTIARLAVPDDPVARLGESGLEPQRAAALYVAACRETHEETGVTLLADQLLPLSRWITPKTPAMMRRRFDTRFFVGLLPVDQDAQHDGQEAVDSAWFTPRDALQAYSDNEINLAPPQLMTLAGLSRFATFGALADSLNGHVPALIEPVSFQDGDSRVIVYPGHERHPVRERAMPGPFSLVWRNNRFEPADGFDGFFV